MANAAMTPRTLNTRPASAGATRAPLAASWTRVIGPDGRTRLEATWTPARPAGSSPAAAVETVPAPRAA